MGNEEFKKLTDEIKASLSSESMEDIQSVLNNILKEFFQNQCIPADGSIAIDIVLSSNSTQPQTGEEFQPQEIKPFFNPIEEQSDSLQVTLSIKPSPVLLNRCVWNGSSFKCS